MLTLPLVRRLATSCVINRCALPGQHLVYRSPSSPVVGIRTQDSGS
jgi:hypothetical protein